VLAGTLGFGVGTIATSSGTLDLTNATLIVSNSVSIGSGLANLNIVSSSVKLLNSTVIGPAPALTTLDLDGATLQLNVNGTATTANISATAVTTNNPSTINIGAVANVSGTVQIPLISYTGTGIDPYGALTLGTLPAGYTANLVDNTGNSSVDLSIASTVKPTPRITGISALGTTLTITATNGAFGGQYVLLGSTNVALPLSQWTPLLTNNFDGSGNLDLSTNIINPSLPRQFYILSQ